MPERSSMPRPCHRPVLCSMLALVLSSNIKLGPLQVIIFIIVQITRIIISQWPMFSNCLCYLCYALCLPFALVFVSRIIQGLNRSLSVHQRTFRLYLVHMPWLRVVHLYHAHCNISIGIIICIIHYDVRRLPQSPIINLKSRANKGHLLTSN